MKTDTLFYQLFQEFPWIFFQLIGKKETNLTAYEFIAPEIKQKAFRLDGLFSTKEEHCHLPLYFVEVQFYQETDFYDRLFPSIFLYFSQYKPENPEWKVIVIFDKKSHDVEIPARYQEIATTRLQRIYLDQIPSQKPQDIGIGILKLVVEPEKQAGELAKNLIARSKSEVQKDQKQLQDIKIAISDYNKKFHRRDNLSISNIALNPETKSHIILIRSFRKGKDQAMAYYNGVMKNSQEFIIRQIDENKSAEQIQFDIYATTQKNYREVIKQRSASGYRQFFEKVYLKV